MVETAASYWEPVIRIYGSSLQPGLVLIILRFQDNGLGFWGEQLAKLEAGSCRFEMALMEQVDQQTSQLILVCKGGMADSICSGLLEAVELTAHSTMERHDAVELLYFHGPHFQDRFGIAEAALGCLQKKNINVLVAGCAGTSIYLVIQDKMGCRAARALADIFVVP